MAVGGFNTHDSTRGENHRELASGSWDHSHGFSDQGLFSFSSRGVFEFLPRQLFETSPQILHPQTRDQSQVLSDPDLLRQIGAFIEAFFPPLYIGAQLVSTWTLSHYSAKAAGELLPRRPISIIGLCSYPALCYHGFFSKASVLPSQCIPPSLIEVFSRDLSPIISGDVGSVLPRLRIIFPTYPAKAFGEIRYSLYASPGHLLGRMGYRLLLRFTLSLAVFVHYVGSRLQSTQSAATQPQSAT